MKLYDNTDLYTIANEIYDFIYDDCEILIKDAGEEKISNENVEYVISVIADNMFEDRLPLEHRLVNEQLVIWQSKDTSPFRKKASDYYEKHLEDKNSNKGLSEESDKESLK